jgi:hypothetical protein
MTPASGWTTEEPCRSCSCCSRDLVAIADTAAVGGGR